MNKVKLKIISATVLVLSAVIGYMLWEHYAGAGSGKRDEDVDKKHSEKPKKKETIEEKARRIELTPIPVPEGMERYQSEVWTLNEKMRVAQARIRRDAGNDGEKFMRDWRTYISKNRKDTQRIQKLRMLIIGDALLTQIPETEEDHAKLQNILSSFDEGKMDQRSYTKRLREIRIRNVEKEGK